MDIFKHTHSNNTATTIKKKKISSHDLKTHLLKSITLLQSVIQQHFLSNTGFKLIFSPQGTNSLRRFLLFETPWTIQFMEFSRPEYWSGQPFPSLGDLPNPVIEPRFPTLQVDSLPAKPQGKPKNTGVGSLFLLQWIFPTQELNWSLLHYRQILYQLSYQGSVFCSFLNLEFKVCSRLDHPDPCSCKKSMFNQQYVY